MVQGNTGAGELCGIALGGSWEPCRALGRGAVGGGCGRGTEWRVVLAVGEVSWG